MNPTIRNGYSIRLLLLLFFFSCIFGVNPILAHAKCTFGYSSTIMAGQWDTPGNTTTSLNHPHLLTSDAEHLVIYDLENNRLIINNITNIAQEPLFIINKFTFSNSTSIPCTKIHDLVVAENESIYITLYSSPTLLCTNFTGFISNYITFSTINNVTVSELGRIFTFSQYLFVNYYFPVPSEDHTYEVNRQAIAIFDTNFSYIQSLDITNGTYFEVHAFLTISAQEKEFALLYWTHGNLTSGIGWGMYLDYYQIAPNSSCLLVKQQSQ